MYFPLLVLNLSCSDIKLFSISLHVLKYFLHHCHDAVKVVGAGYKTNIKDLFPEQFVLLLQHISLMINSPTGLPPLWGFFQGSLNLSKCFPTGTVTSFQIPFYWCNEHSHMLVWGTFTGWAGQTEKTEKSSLQPVVCLITLIRAAGNKNIIMV